MKKRIKRKTVRRRRTRIWKRRGEESKKEKDKK
jgi:hypothetical protein